MTTINKLNEQTELSLGDLLALFSTNNGAARKVSLSTLKTFINADDTQADDKETQYAAPSATGFTVNVNNNGNSIWLIMEPTAGFDDGTLVLPPVASCLDKQEILVNCSQAIQALTINPNGATLDSTAPTGLSDGAFFLIRFDKVMSKWYRVG